jgi:hypothetical protein
MARQVRMELVDSGLVPTSEGWFVVNVRDAAWLMNDAFGARCGFEGDVPLVRGPWSSRAECVLLVEGDERRLGTSDFVHCPPRTAHVPSLQVGARSFEWMPELGAAVAARSGVGERRGKSHENT